MKPYSAVGRSVRYGKKVEDKRVWPFEPNTAYFIWRNAIKKARFGERFQYNNSVERFIVHPHVFRKFFRIRMVTVMSEATASISPFFCFIAMKLI